MGVFGVSASEEQKLREAARRQSVLDDSASHTTSTSAFETADEGESEAEGFASNEHHDESDVHSEGAETIKDDPDEIEKADNTFADSVEADDENDAEATNSSTKEKSEIHGAFESAKAEDFPVGQSSKESNDHENAKSEHSSQESAIHVSSLDWDGPDDKANPHNWSSFKKWYCTFTVAIVCLCNSLGSSLFVSSVPELSIKFGASQELCISGLTFYLLGLAFGPVLTSPLSELIGRRWVYLGSFPLSIIITLGMAFSKNIGTILVLRFLIGYFASPALAIAGGTMTDLWASNPLDLSLSVALFCCAPFLGPVIGPIVGGFAAEYKGYKWSISWVSMMFSGAILPFLILVPETYKPAILHARAKKRGLNVYKTKLTFGYVKVLLTSTLLRPLEMLIVEPIVCVMSIYIAFVFAVLFGFFEAFPIIFRGEYHMDLGNSGLAFIGVGIGLISGVILHIIIDKVYTYPKNPDGTRGKRDENGKLILPDPEHILLSGKIGAICLPIALFWLAWTGRNDSIHWMVPIAAGYPFGLGLILVFFSVVLYFSMSFSPNYVASALAANNLLRYVLASVFPLFTTQMYDRLGIDWATSLFAFIALAMVPIPFIFVIIGPKLRARSKYGYAAFFKQLHENKLKQAEAEQENVEKSKADPFGDDV